MKLIMKDQKEKIPICYLHQMNAPNLNYNLVRHLMDTNLISISNNGCKRRKSILK